MKNKNHFSLITLIVSFIFISGVIGYFVMPEMDGWYKTLNRSYLSPPDYLYPIVWNILYTFIAISGWLIWNSEPFANLGLIKTAYLLQIILNWAWNPVFFSYHLLTTSLIVMLLMDFFIATVVFLSYKKLKLVSLFMLIYLLWNLFATYLKFYIFMCN